MRVHNETGLFHASRVTSRRPPQPEMSMVVRGTFSLVDAGVVELLEAMEHGPLCGDVYDGDDTNTAALSHATDFSEFKLSAEVLLIGSAHAPHGTPVPRWPVRLTVGDWKKELMIYGPRRWKRGKPTDAEPVESVALTYDNAFGGAGHDLNPVGSGIEGDALPQVELPSAPIMSRNDRPPPASFAALSPRWPQRAARVGRDYGASYRKTRAPYYAADHDWRFFSAAPEDQWFDGYLKGDETVVLQNLHPDAPVFKTQLPGWRVRVLLLTEKTGSGEAELREVPMVLDTLLLEPEERRLKLSWRGLCPVREDDLDDISHAMVIRESLTDDPPPAEHYRDRLDAFAKDPSGVLAGLPADLIEEWERVQKRRRGEDVPEREIDPNLDPVSAALKRKLGPLISDEDLSSIGKAVESLDDVPDDQRPDLKKLVADAALKDLVEPPPMRVLKPGRMPPVNLKETMRDVVERIKEIEASMADMPSDSPEGLSGQANEMLEALRKIPHDPGLKEIDPAYEPPEPLSTDAPGPGADLSERDLSDQDLSGVDLTGADLTHATLCRTNLRGAILRDATLHCATLFQADLTGADLEGADLTLVNAAYVTAIDARFVKANLDEGFFEEAILRGAVFDDASACYAIFVGADLTDAHFERAILDNADFSGASLIEAKLGRAQANKALFIEIRGDRANFVDAEMAQATFEKASLREAQLAGLRAPKGYFERANLDGADLAYSVLSDAHLTKASARTTRFYGADLSGARLYRTKLDGAKLHNTNLMGADLRKAEVSQASFKGASVFDAVLLDMRGDPPPDFSGVDVTRAITEEG